MPELINRQSALSVCKEYGWIDDEVFIEGYNTAIKDMREAIKELLTVEAEPVRHGRWIEESANEYYCSYCGKYAPIVKNMRHCDCSKWCKECGTKMDGGE